MAKKFVCVELSDRIVKVSVSLGTEKKRKVKDAFLFEAPDGTIEDGLIQDPARFGALLAREMENRKCGDAKEIIFTIASTKVATREVKMPLLADNKIATVVENNKKEYFPLDVTDYLVRFRVLSRVKKGDDKGCNVVVMAMPKNIVDACNTTALAGGMKLKGVDLVSSSMADGVAVLKQTQVTAFVAVEPTHTNICFMKGNELLLQRPLTFGGDDMISFYREACEEKSDSQLSFMEALDDLTNINAEDNISGKLDDDDITELLERVVGSISRSVDFFNSNKGGGVSQLVLLGTCANMLGLEDMLEQATDVPTVQMAQLSTATPLRSISQTPAYYMTSMYAGAHTVNFGSDLDPKKQKGNKNKEIDLPTVILIFILMMVFSVYWSYSAYLEHSLLEEELARLDSEIAAMEYLDGVAANDAAYEQSKTDLLNFTAMTANPNENLVLFLAELEAKMPSELLVMSATCTSASVSMNLVVNSLVEAATVVSKLRTFESIEVIQVSGLSMNWVQFEGEGYSQAMLDGFEEVSFSVVCSYGNNPYMADINPYAGILGIPAVPYGSMDTDESIEVPAA